MAAPCGVTQLIVTDGEAGTWCRIGGGVYYSRKGTHRGLLIFNPINMSSSPGLTAAPRLNRSI